MQKPKHLTPLFSVQHKPPIIMRAKCDVCGVETLSAYIPELDKWLCGACVQTIVELLELYDIG
jgi:formylmethanofuran dehydrogenase subunit E